MPVRFPGTMFAAGLLLPFRQCIQRERTTAMIFQLVNLPVEFNASTRAKAILADMGVATGPQAIVVKQVLDAAALTYVAATLSSVMTLLYMLIHSGLLGDRRSH